MKKNYTAFFLVLLIMPVTMLVTMPVYSEVFSSSGEFLDYLSAEQLKRLSEDEHIYRYDNEGYGALLRPPLSDDLEGRQELPSAVPEIMVEALYTIPYPEDSNNPEVIIADLYKLSHQVSGISGVKYFSERRNRYTVLFTDVYAIDNPVDKNKIADPIPSKTETDSLFLHMKENALGRGVYRIEYNLSQQQLTIKLQNESKLGFVVTVVEPQDMQIFLEIIPCTDQLVVYGYCGVIVQNDDFVDLMLDPYFAFYRRMTAMETWLYNSLHNTDKLPPLNEPMP